MTTLRLTLAGDDAEMTRLADAVGRFAEAQAVDALATARLLTALDEVVTNVAHHGRLPAGDAIVVELTRLGDGVVVMIEDPGPAFDPLRQAPVEGLDAPLEQRTIGGLGLHILRNLTADLAYARTPAGRNRLSFRIAC